MASELGNIIARPNDLAARVNYAATLDNPERAEFILKQVWLAEHAEEFDSKEWLSFTRSVSQLEQKYGREWWPQELERAGVTEVEFHAGFVEHITIETRRLLDDADAIFPCAPIRHLTLSGAHRHCRELFSLNLLDQIVSLDLGSCRLDDGDVAHLAQARLPELRWLSLAGNRITFAGVRSLALAAGLPSLEFADFEANPCDPGDALSYDEGGAVDSFRTAEGTRLEQECGPVRWLRRLPVSLRNRFHTASRYQSASA